LNWTGQHSRYRLCGRFARWASGAGSRLLISDGQPFELATSYYPLEIARGTGLTSPGKIRGGAVNLLKQLGYNSFEFIDRVSVRLPTTQEFEVLELPDDIPVHRTFRT
jgi:GntR family transcriptional regulator